MWEEFGHDQVVYAYIDHLQQAAENAFGIVDSGEGNREGETRLQMSPEHKIAILDYDMKAKKDAFEKETFECGICLGKWSVDSRCRIVSLTDLQIQRKVAHATECWIAGMFFAANVCKISTTMRLMRATLLQCVVWPQIVQKRGARL